MEVVKGDTQQLNEKIKDAVYSNDWIDLGSGVRAKGDVGGFSIVEINGNKKRISTIEAENLIHEELNTDSNKPKFNQYQLAGEKENYKEIMIVLPREGSMKKVGDYTVPSAHKYGEDLADNRRVVHLRMNTRTDAEGNKVLFLEEVQSDWGQTGKKEGFLLTEKEAGKAWEEADKKYADFMKRMENKYGSEWEIEMEKMEVEEETKLLDARENTKGGTIQQAPFVTDTNAWTKLGLKVALKEAVTQGADKISWTTGEQQNARYDLSKQVDSIKSYRNSDGTYSIQGIKDGEVIFSQSELQEAQLEGVIGKELANKIINNEGTDIGTQVSKDLGRTDREFTGKDLQVGGSGMKGFYGSPTENKLGIVGSVAKALVKELTGKQGEIVETNITTQFKQPTREIYESNKGKWFVDWTENDGGTYQKQFNTEQEARIWAKENLTKQTATQHSIEITPELKAAVEKGAERIAWTTGEQQNERYDLSKQVSSIDYEKKQDGRYFLHFNQGVNSFSETIEETRLADYVGKDVANRIINGEGSLAEISPLIIKDSFTDKYDIVIDNKTIKSNFDTYNDAFNWYKRNPKYENVKRLEGANLKVGGKGMKCSLQA